MQHRRKSRFTWLPTLGTDITVGEETTGYSYTRQVLTPEPSGGTGATANNSEVIPLVADATFEASDRTDALTLRDRVEGQDWLLKRIVGSIFVAGTEPQSLDQNRSAVWQAGLVTVGFLVARAGDLNTNSIDLTRQEADPQSVDNTWNPWIWRRSWLIGFPGVNPDGGVPQGFFGGDIANSNMAYGDMRSGPHIDSKVSRRIRKEHRLWLSVKVTGWDPFLLNVAGSIDFQPQVSICTDLRFLGAMRRSKNVSSF